MVCPFLISVSLVPGPYCFSASAGGASSSNAAPRRIILRTDIGLPPYFLGGASVSERSEVGKRRRRMADIGNAALPSGRAVPGRLSGLVRFRGARPDAERRARVRHRLRIGPEEYPAARRKLLLLAHHAGGDPVDIRNLGAAKPKRVVAAGLLLLLRIGLACGRQHRHRKRSREQQTETESCRWHHSDEPPDALMA